MQEVEKSSKIKLCLIGVGSFGSLLYKKASELNLCEIKYCYHPNIEKARMIGSEKGISDLDIALKDASIDGAIIATPNNLHYEQIIKCLQAKKHIFVEKPMTASYEEGLKLKKIIERNKDIIFMVGHNHRRKSYIRYLKRLLAEGTLGQIVSVNINISHGGIFNFSENSWRADINRHKEGPLITVGIHIIDTIHYLFGPVKSVYAMIRNISNKAGAPDCNSVLIELPNKTMIYFQANYNMPSEEYLTVYGTEGIFYVNRDKACLRIGRDLNKNGNFTPSPQEELKLAEIDTYTEELEEFCNAILHKKDVETGLKEGLNALAVIDACNKSNESNKAVFMNCYKDYFVD